MAKVKADIPQCEVEGDSYRFRFPDQTRLDVLHPSFDRQGRLLTEVVAFRTDQESLTRAKLDLFNLHDRERFHAHAGTVNGAVNWLWRLNFALEHVRNLLTAAATVDTDREAETVADPWPILADEALYGLAGELVRAIDPYTEADPVALLLNFLTAFGNLVGDRPHFRVEFTRHPLRLFVGLVGESAKARKGQSWSTPRHVCARIDAAWASDRVTSGLSSGEGLIYAVRDQRVELQPIKDKGRVKGYQEVIVDPGASDKRLLVVEEELAQALKVMSREGNILSPVLRQAWDMGHLHPLTKHNPIRATGAHISVIGHITKDELLRHLDSTEQANGFANRFLWVCVQRSKAIPKPTGIPHSKLEPLIVRLEQTVAAAKMIEVMDYDAAADQLWSQVYADLSKGKPGLLGAITARAEAEVTRLACLYAALDQSLLVPRAASEGSARGLALRRAIRALDLW
jgi:hypothetical protein